MYATLPIANSIWHANINIHGFMKQFVSDYSRRKVTLPLW